MAADVYLLRDTHQEGQEAFDGWMRGNVSNEESIVALSRLDAYLNGESCGLLRGVQLRLRGVGSLGYGGWPRFADWV